MVVQMKLVHLISILISIISLLLFSLKEAAAASMAKPGCPETCGNVSIIYPFGIGKDCYLDKDFEITCHNSSLPQPVIHMEGKDEVQVLHMSLDYIRIRASTSLLCYANYTSEGKSYAQILYPPMKSFSLSHTDNKFVAIGCDIYAYIGNYNATNSTIKNYISGCVSVCNEQGWSRPDTTNYSCSGVGCCQATFPDDLSTCEILVGNMSSWPDRGNWPSDKCSLVLTPEKNFSELHQFDVSFSNINKTYFYPAILNWGIGNKSCGKAQKLRDYVCGSNSHCVDSIKGSGYTCQCNSGYTGNPYLSDGCADINECMELNNNICKKGAVCINTNGSYYCNCPHGYHNNDDENEIRCVRDKEKLKAAILVSSGIGTTLVLLILLVIGFRLHHELEKRKKNKLKQKFFKKNGGLLLQQQISSNSQGNVEKTKLFTIEELEKATDNFNAERVLGKGGYGQVYKGMLLDGSIVAIKKSIIVDEKQVADFVNEVFILSQINHRHIVKLLGCCLESEVPLLVYEFVSNSTLYHHLHDKEEHASTLCWEKRLQIADEIAGALAYLHSYASPTILHRDIKSSNILLDENFRAVVSDFGLSRSIASEKTHLTTLVQGTFGYLDPEYFRSGQYTDKSDVYAFGMVLAEILTGEKVISSSRPEESLAIHFRSAMKQDCLLEILDKVIMDEGQKEVIAVVAKLAKSCLKLSGKKRPSMREIAAELERLRTTEQTSLQETFQDNYSVSSRSYSYASTSAVTEEYVLQGQEFPRSCSMTT